MRVNTKRFIPLLTLILCTVLAISLPITTLAVTTLTVTGFDSSDLANHFTATGSLDGSTGSVSVSGNVITIKATGSKLSCDYVPSTTKVELKALQTISFKCTLTDAAGLDSSFTENDDGTKTVVVGEGNSVVFSVYSDNTDEAIGTVTITDIQAAVPKVPSDCAAYSNNGKVFDYLDLAIASAQSGSDKTIVVKKNGVVYHSSVEEKDSNNGEYSKSFTIPSGVTLLIPHNDAGTLYTTSPYSSNNEKKTVSTFKELTVPNGTSIAVDGTLAVSGELLASNGGDAGIPNGPHGMIKMATGSSITINSGAGLYCYGFITDTDKNPSNGSGTVLVKNGGTVCECFQLMDYRGGSVSTSSDLTNKKIFPGTQFYVQNVEVPMTLEAGATENAYTAVYVTYQNATEAVPFIGKGSAFINMENGSVTKRYDGTSDRLIIDVNGDATLSALKIPVKKYATIDSSKYVLCLNGNMTLNINSGSDITVNQHIGLLPGTEVTIAEGANMTLGTVNGEAAEIHVYGKNQWNNFCYYETAGEVSGNSRFVEVRYAPGKAYTRTAADMGDAKVIIGGTIDATNGKLYTSYGTATVAGTSDTSSVIGPSIQGSANGKIIMPATNDAKLAYQYIQNSGAYQIRMVSPYLAHSNAETIQSVAGTSYIYDANNGKWVCATHTGIDTDHTCDVCGFVTECADADPKDHNCDICGKEKITECADTDGDSLCDICGANLCAHEGEVTPVAEVLATCVTDGHKAYWTCDTCGKSFSDEAYTTEIPDLETWKTGEGLIEATGHTYGEAAYSWAADYSSCTVTLTCSVCEEGTVGHALSATDSRPESRTVPGDCQTNAETTYTASVELNGTTYSKTETVTGEKNTSVHVNIVDVAGTPATCTEIGYTDGTYCNDCETWISGHAEIPAAGHTPGEAVGENRVESTCTAEGSYDNVVYCTVCNAELSRNTVTVEKIAHTPAAAVEEKRVESTCTVAGSYDSVVYCSSCNTELSRATKPLELAAHTEGAVVVENEVAATCTAEGSYDNVTYCTVCNEELSRNTVTVEKIAHNPAAAVEEKRVESTCTVAGSYDSVVYCSSCNTELSRETKTLELAAHTGGAVVVENEVAATCTAEGSYDNVTYCTVCNEELSRNTVTVEKIAHTPAAAVEENRVESTCTVAGSYDSVVYCSSCNTELSREAKALELAVHTGGAVVVENEVAATCTAEGSYDNVVYCTVCNAELSRNTVTVEKTAHTPAAAVEENRLESTCTVAGSYDSVVYCTVCNAELSRNTVTVEKTAHTPAAAVEENRVESTCTVAGSYDSVVYCSACNTELSRETKTLEMAVHTEGAVVVENEVAATCSAEGSYDNVVYCTVCNAELSRNTVTVEKVAHTMSHTAAKDASCTETGKLEFWHCSACEGYFKDAQGTEAYEENAWIIGKTNHTFETTYTTDGEYHWYKCSNSACDAIDDKAKHSYNDGVVTKEPTCTAEGIKTFTCTCGYSYTAGIVATGHRNTEVRNGSEATCGMNGYTGDTYCNDCETTIANGKVIPATGEHTYDNACDAECNVCSAIRTPADHVYDNACDTNCNVCGAERSITHAWKDATCTDPKTCTVCGATEGEATGHVNTTSSTVQNDDGSTHTTTVTCACGEVVSIATGTCTDAGSGSCECGRVMQAKVNVDNKTKTEDIWTVTGTTMNVKHDLACVVLVEETDGTYSRLNATAKADGSYDFDVSGVGNKKVVIAVKGDTSGDGNADISDALQIVYSGISNTKPAYQALNSYQACVGELSGDRSVDITDALQIVYSGISTTKPAYAPIEWDVLP